MLLGGYSQCALGDLIHSLDVRPKTAESGAEPEDRASEFSSYSSNARFDKSAHLESEQNGRTRVCQAPRIDIS